MACFRTDLASEAFDRLPAGQSVQNGIEQHEDQISGYPVRTVTVASAEGAELLGKAQGTYQTLTLSPLHRREQDAFTRACHALGSLLSVLLPPLPSDAPVLVLGVGNRQITPDAIGPLAAQSVIATRHLIQKEPYFHSWRPVSVLSPGVLGQTGMEVGEVLGGTLDRIRPACIIAVDALAAGRLTHLLHTVQLTDTGIAPGSGIGNTRQALCEDTLGVPVLALGVPTVVDGATLAQAIREQQGVSLSDCEALSELARPVLVTTKDIDQEVQNVAKLIGYAINLALQPQLSVADIDLFLS